MVCPCTYRRQTVGNALKPRSGERRYEINQQQNHFCCSTVISF